MCYHDLISKVIFALTREILLIDNERREKFGNLSPFKKKKKEKCVCSSFSIFNFLIKHKPTVHERNTQAPFVFSSNFNYVIAHGIYRIEDRIDLYRYFLSLITISIMRERNEGGETIEAVSTITQRTQLKEFRTQTKWIQLIELPFIR